MHGEACKEVMRMLVGEPRATCIRRGGSLWEVRSQGGPWDRGKWAVVSFVPLLPMLACFGTKVGRSARKGSSVSRGTAGDYGEVRRMRRADFRSTGIVAGTKETGSGWRNSAT